ncbi:MAG: type II toxin-antitoxin system HicA family toxin [Sulfuricellaceae bacterium]|nr:type II toxin-antitoxin system HicA family toxin [Sulfuricellaceae bacterium]
MKRGELIRLLVKNRCHLHRHGANHDIYLNLRNGRKAPVPRHSEIKDSLAKLIFKQLDIELS